MVPQIIWVGGCFMVWTVYFSSKRFPFGLRTCLLRATNCCNVDSTEKMTFLHLGMVQLTCHLAKSRHFFFMAGIRRGFRAGFIDFRSNSLLGRHETVLTLTSVPLDRKTAQIFFHELVGDRMTTRRIVWSSLSVVFLGLPLRFRSV